MVRAALALALCLPAAAFAAPLDDAAPFRTQADASTPGATATASPAPAAPATQVAPPEKAQPSQITRLSTRALLIAADMQRTFSPINTLLPSGERAALGAADVPVADGDGRIKTVLQKALALLGTPYRWGGTDPDKGFDCSGLVGYVFRNALGIELPRVSRDMAKNGELITDRAKLAAGDLVFFGLKGRVNHVGIYVGEGRFVHAPSRGKDVTVSSLEQGYWSGRFLSARRVSTEG
jgi:cell wall-associated NlpC family hydrolase